MALKMDVVTADDNEISQAYFKIVTTVVEWEADYAVVVVGAWKGKNAYQNDKRQLTLEQDLSFKMEFTEEPVTRQGIYDWLKTQEYFTTAVDATE
jgi:hypothetical protein